MKNARTYVNEQIYEELLISTRILAEDRQGYSLSHPRLNPVICEKISSLSDNASEEKLYNILAGLIVTSTHPFAITDQDCLKKLVSGYKQFIPLIKDREVKKLAEHHLYSTKFNLRRLELISIAEGLKDIRL